jgi:long-chain acyl-CoA synthetase
MLTQLLRKAVEADPVKTAIVYGNERVSYKELERRVNGFACGLRKLGIGKGDSVVAVLHNCPEFIVAFLACARLQAVFLPLNPLYTRAELERFIADAHGRVIVCSGPVVIPCREIARNAALNIPVVAVGNATADVLPFASLSAQSDFDVSGRPYSGGALYLYTSGSTETYKRVCCTQENLFFEACNFVETMKLNVADTILCTIPLYHSYGIGNCLLDAIYLGATLVILEPASLNGDSRDTPFIHRCHRVAELIRDEHVRFYPGVPYQFAVLSALSTDFPIDLSSVRLLVSSGDFLRRQTYERFLSRFGKPIRSLYGSTEAGSISIDTDPAERIQFGSLGLPLKNVCVEIRDPNGRPLPEGQDGEIWVKSPCIPPGGYDNRPDLTAQIFRDGFYNTGDIGRKDSRGHLVMTGRKQKFVDVGGQKVDVGEVEEVVLSHPRVREVAVLGVEIRGLGTVIKAVVVADDACNQANLLSHCRERLAAFKIPRLIEFVETLPRSSVGKVLKAQLTDVTAFLNSVRTADFQRDCQLCPNKGRERQIEMLQSYIREEVCATLQRDALPIDRVLSFQSMGFDSLGVAELQRRLSKLTGLELPVTMLWNYANIEELTQAIWSLMVPRTDEVHVTSSSGEALSVEDLDDLSRDEIATRLAQELRAVDGGDSG